MNISINISEDKELRLALKDMIRGAVKAITREEIIQIVCDEVSRKSKINNAEYVDRIVEETISAQVQHALKPKWGDSFIQKTATAIIKEKLAGMRL